MRNYLVVTAGYWAFTLTDGAIRMLVVLYFHLLGYSPFEVAMLFLFYEFFGIVTNLVGGWLGARVGLNLTMLVGMGLQVFALVMLMVPELWLSVGYVMLAQALSGIAKDLNKMAAKASVKLLLPAQASDSRLFKWVAVLTGSKNALKGLGFFVGAGLMQWLGFRGALVVLASGLFCALLISAWLLPSGLGKTKAKPAFSQVFATQPLINWLAAARFFLFGARDIWFVVALPVYLYTVLGWEFVTVGSFMAVWVMGYGLIQASAPLILRHADRGRGPNGFAALTWVAVLALVPASIAMLLSAGMQPDRVVVIGLLVFGVVFALNSAVHSYLIVAWSAHDEMAKNVGFYYMANAGGRLAGTVLSGLIYQSQGLIGCLWWSSVMLVLAGLISIRFSRV